MPTLPQELVHPEWNGVYRDSDHVGVHIGHKDIKVESWIVRLVYRFRNGSFHGSGYFLNFPVLQDHELILTSAGNIFDSTGKRAQGLEVIDCDRNALQVVEIWHCPLYCSRQNPAHDYAVIKVKRTAPVVEGRGFGYSLCLSESYYNPDMVRVTGYGQGLRSEELTTTTGRSIRIFGDEGESLEYQASTCVEQGSGCVVWIQYDGYPTALAIQNRGLGKRGGGHACRLTTTLLRGIFDWLAVSRNRVKLQADSRQGTNVFDPSSGPFCLYFSPEFLFARVKLGDGSALDVVPAQVVARSAKVSYAVSHKGKWVLFDPLRQQVVLQDRLSDRCLFFEDKKPNTSVAIVLAHREGGELFQLRIQGEMIYDFVGEDSESSEVSMIPYPAEIGIQFVCFKFVPYMDGTWWSANMCGSDGK